MVSLWPWKGDATSAASFEKALASLSSKISKTSARRNALRERSRRFKFLLTVYTSFAYTICSLILALVTGRTNWGYLEYGAVVGGPFVIYAARKTLAAYYSYRISTVESQLNDLQKQRDRTIGKLKEATKFDTTKQLLDRYGGEPRETNTTISDSSSGSKGAGRPRSITGRTNIPPPPTANIPRGPPVQFSGMPQLARPSTADPAMPGMTLPASPTRNISRLGAEFAPNAFTSPPQYSPSAQHWYDRMMDLILGEDETQPKNRLALICRHCKLVNGQAPPGMQSLGEVGKWRCGNCKGWNGEEDETQKALREISQQAQMLSQKPGVSRSEGHGSAKGKENASERPMEAERDDYDGSGNAEPVSPSVTTSSVRMDSD